jgi:16S rRNA (adenine(1408)-N(1))-methyltransferase
MSRAAGRATRNRLENALFVQAAVEALPPELAGTADRITLNFPWGSLLKAVAVPDREVLAAIARLGKPGADVTLLVNMSVFDDTPYAARLGLPCPPVLSDLAAARAAYRPAGLEVTAIDPGVTRLPFKTTWGQKLTKGTRRRVLRLDAVVR